MTDQEPLVLPFRADHQQLVEGLAAIVRAIEGLKVAEERTEEQTKKTATALDTLDRGLSNVRGGFRDTYDVIETWIGRINSAVDRVTALASEQERLDRLTSRTGLNFDEAAASAGRFADETEAAGAAGAFLQAGTQLTQRELNALMRVAGAASQTLGITTTQAVQQLTEALRKGEAEGLGRFSPALAQLAGNSHTTAERLDELVRQADRTTAATDDAGDAVRRFRDSLEDGARTIATSFVREMARLDGLGRPFRDARSDAEEFNRTLTAIGQTAAHLVSQVGASLNFAVGALQYAGGQVSRPIFAAARLAGMPTQNTAISQGEQRMRDAVNRLEALYSDLNDDRRSAPADNASAPARVDMNISAAERDAAEAAATRRGRGHRPRSPRRPTLDQLMERGFQHSQRGADALDLREADPNEGGFVDRRARDERNATARERDADLERRQWERSDAGLRAENDNARVARQEERALDHRRQNLRSFTDFYEEQHGRQLVAAQEAANGVTMAVDAMGQAYAKNLVAWAKGQLSFEEAANAMLAGTLDSIAQESAAKSAFNIAEGIAALATYRWDAAAQHFAAAAAYGVLAYGSGFASSEVSANAPKKSADADKTKAEQSRVSTGRGRASNDNGSGTTTIVENYFAPVIGGREATDGEVGRGMQRYTGAADRRRLGRTGTGP